MDAKARNLARAAVYATTLAAMVLSTPSAAGAATQVTTCGQSFHGSGFLAADLDCSGTGQAAVRIAPPGQLDLMGHTLTADVGITRANLDRSPISLVSSAPGGMLVGTGVADGIGISAPRLKISDVTITGFDYGVRGGRTRLRNSTVSGCTQGGVYLTLVESSLSVVASDISSNGGFGIDAPRVSIKDSTVNDNGAHGVICSRSKIRSSSIDGNGDYGLWGSVHKIRESSVSGNVGDGIIAGIRVVLRESDVSNNGGSGIGNFEKARLRTSTISNNGSTGITAVDPPSSLSKVSAVLTRVTMQANVQYGLLVGGAGFSSSVRVAGSTLTGNGTDAGCGVSIACADVATSELPAILDTSVCDASYVIDSGIPGTAWGTCTLD